MMTESLAERVQYAMEQVENGDPLKDFLDDDEIIEALELLVWYVDKFGEYE
jgi:hypothetical protein